MEQINLPKPDDAVVMSFGELASVIRDFVIYNKSNGIRVRDGELKLLCDLINILKQKYEERFPLIPPKPTPPSEPEQPLALAITPEVPIDLSFEEKQKIWAAFYESRRRKNGASEAIQKRYQEDLREYRIAQREHERANEIYQSRYEKLTKDILQEKKIYEARAKDVEELVSRGGWPPLTELKWRILPPGYWPKSITDVERFLPSDSSAQYCQERILHAYSLHPNLSGQGNGEFEKYFFFCYDFTDKVLLESAYDGNAAFILDGDWMKLSQKSKYELIHEHADQVERIIHRQESDWKNAITNALRRKI